MSISRLPLLALCLLPALARADLADYVAKPDTSFQWKKVNKREIPGGVIYQLSLTSQTWQGIDWKHDILIADPDKAKHTSTVFLWNTGGKASPSGALFAMQLATRMKAPVAFVYGVPNQPLLGGKKEDALIAETFVRYLAKKDASWPLLFPMVKTVTRSMDAIQAFAKKEWETEVKDFVVSGASKRGWTSWLTAAADPRVKAVMPVVIDTLNMKEQMPHQLASFGKYSDQIHDYTKAKLVPMPNTPEAKKLWSMVDPWLYRAKYKMPKMVLNGTNDPYWAQDALNLYWDGLPGPKWVAYVPNAGHNLKQKFPGGKENSDRATAVLSAFGYCMIHNEKMPDISWKFSDTKESSTVEVKSTPTPKAVRLWTADADTRDFRKSTWTEVPAKWSSGKLSATVAVPAKGFRVFLAECDYEVGGVSFSLTTQVRILGKPLK